MFLIEIKETPQRNDAQTRHLERLSRVDPEAQKRYETVAGWRLLYAPLLNLNMYDVLKPEEKQHFRYAFESYYFWNYDYYEDYIHPQIDYYSSFEGRPSDLSASAQAVSAEILVGMGENTRWAPARAQKYQRIDLSGYLQARAVFYE